MGKLIQVKEEDISVEKIVTGWTSYSVLSGLVGYYGTEYETNIILERKLR